MKKTLGLSLLVGLMFLSGCAITHEFGPYMGKVVDKETEEPIEGAVVFMPFYTKSGNVGGSTSYYADAVEVQTDNKGDFLIPPYTVRVNHPLHSWDLYPNPIVFKPGYGAYPGHHGTTLSHYKNHEFPENELVTIKLPKLKTRKEKIDNLSNLYPGSAPQSAYKTLRQLEQDERKEAGLQQ